MHWIRAGIGGFILLVFIVIPLLYFSVKGEPGENARRKERGRARAGWLIVAFLIFPGWLIFKALAGQGMVDVWEVFSTMIFSLIFYAVAFSPQKKPRESGEPMDGPPGQ